VINDENISVRYRFVPGKQIHHYPRLCYDYNQTVEHYFKRNHWCTLAVCLSILVRNCLPVLGLYSIRPMH